MKATRLAPRWRLLETISWVGYREVVTTDAGDDGRGPGFRYAVLLCDLADAASGRLSPWSNLRAALQAGEIEGFGRRNGGGEVEAIPAGDWLFLDLLDVPQLTERFGIDYVSTARAPFGAGQAIFFWSDLSFPITKVRKVFPPIRDADLPAPGTSLSVRRAAAELIDQAKALLVAGEALPKRGPWAEAMVSGGLLNVSGSRAAWANAARDVPELSSKSKPRAKRSG